MIAGNTARYGFITRWAVAGDATARTITLPLSNGNGSTFNCTIDWGDGTAFSTVTAYNDANRIHTYAANGTYNVEIRGKCEGWSFNNAGDKLKLTSIINWGSRGIFGGFKYLMGGFYGCTNNTSLGVGKILISGAGPTDLYACFQANALTTIPAGFLDKLTVVTILNSCFSTNHITTIPAGLFDHCTLVTDCYGCFYHNNLTAIPSGLFALLPLVLDFTFCFATNTALQLTQDTYYSAGGESTRFLNKAVNFTSCYSRASFTGIQGAAPDLWNCDFGETITLDVAPAVDWAIDDVITGQTSAAVATVVSKVSTFVYKIKKHFGIFALDEIVGVTGTPNKLANQGAANPIFVGTPISTGCFGGAGNSLTSLTNYASIPASWK